VQECILCLGTTYTILIAVYVQLGYIAASTMALK